MTTLEWLAVAVLAVAVLAVWLVSEVLVPGISAVADEFIRRKQ